MKTVSKVNWNQPGQAGSPKPRGIKPRVSKSPRFNGTPRMQPAKLEGRADLQAPERKPRESISGDTLLLYLREIGQVQLLTRQEEIVLANRIKKGDEEAANR